MLWTILTVVGAYFVTELLGYVVHVAAHHRWSGPLYRNHLVHHAKLYPTSRFSSEVYESSLRHSLIPWYAPIFVVTLSAAWIMLPLTQAIAAVVTVALVALFNNHIHDAYHIDNHWLNRHRWFRRLRALHYVHHKHVTKNIGIYVFWIDSLMRRFKRLSPADLLRFRL
jgi:sterol desaturase/sphingolipid hydroxylase (fatty acid hydroxylase superfamily)